MVRVWVWAAVSALLVSAVVVTPWSSPPPAEAAQVAAVAPLPECVVEEGGSRGLGCAPADADFGAEVEGLFSVGNSFTVITTGSGLDWCHHYKETECLYALSDPTITRCVYLFEDDPTDVRSCGNDLSTTGPLGAANAQRQGTCHGELGSTYIYGGPAYDPSTYWDARAPKLARCEFKVTSPHAIDNLKGPTFFLVRTSVTECVQEFGFGCDESNTIYEYHQRYVWVPVHGTLAPRASFEWEKGNQPGKIDFDNTSVPFEGVNTWEWDFDDEGATSIKFEPSHTYEESGVYSVRLTMTGPEGQTRTTTKDVIVNLEKVDLLVKVSDPTHADPSLPEYDLGDIFTLTVRVVAVGDGDLDDVRPVGGLLALPEQLAAIKPLPIVAPFSLPAGGAKSWSVQVRAVDIGHFTAPSTWTARDEFGIPIDDAIGSIAGVVAGPDLAPQGDLTVTVEPDPSVLETEGDVPATPVPTLITIRNETPDTFYKEVSLSRPLAWSPLYQTPDLVDVGLDFDDPAAVEAAFGADQLLELGPLAPGEEHTYEYDLVVEGRAHARLVQLVLAETEGGETYRSGTATVRIGGDTADAEPIVPARLLETRVGPEYTTVDGLMEGIGRLKAGSVTELPVLGRGGIEDDAPAVILNVTAVFPSGPGFLTVFPCGEKRPTASNVNFSSPGDVVPNAVLAKVGADGTVCIYTLVDTDLIVDANGFAPVGGELDPVSPARLLETRQGTGLTTVDTSMQGIGRVAADSITELPVTNRGGVDANALAVMLNVTAVLPDGPGFLTVFPCGQKMPTASNVNYFPGDVVPNAVLAKVGDGGKVCVYSLAATDLVVDVNGFVPEGAELGTVVPARLLETRQDDGLTTADGEMLGVGRVAGDSVIELPVTGRGGVPDDATAVFLNVTAVFPSGPGFVTVYPCGAPVPTASNLNYFPGDVTPNAVLAKVGVGGKVCLYSLTETDLVVDVNGFVPAG